MHGYNHHHHHHHTQEVHETIENVTTSVTTETLPMDQQSGLVISSDQTVGQQSGEPSESDSRRSSTKRRVMDIAAARIRHQYSMEMVAPPLTTATIQQQPPLPFNRISRQRIKRLSRESILRTTPGAADDAPAFDNVSISAIPPNMTPTQRHSGSSLRQTILGGITRKTSTESASKVQQSTPTNMPSTSSFSHGGSVKQPKKVAFAKSELDDFDQQLFKPHEFDDVFNDLKLDA